MPRSLISRAVDYSNCHARSLTISHLTRKLERLNERTTQTDARSHHYIQRDRVEQQLIEASAYLC